MMLSEVQAQYAPRLQAVRNQMAASLGTDISLLDRTNAALLEGSGKFLRPLLCLLSADACGGSTPTTLRYAAAAEMIHNATLLHDDVVDASPLRRGKPTVLSLLGGTASVLIGDFWLVRAIENLLCDEALSPRVLRLFAGMLSDLSEGEILQLQKTEHCDTTEEDYLRIIHCKTASLFRAAALSGAISVGASPEAEAAIETYALCLGKAFQIKDDIFDYDQAARVGKPVGIDILEQKITLPLLGALQAAEPKEAAALRARVRDIPSHPEYQADIQDFVARYAGLNYAVSCLETWSERAIDALAVLPESSAREALVSLARYNQIRTQ